MNISFHGSHNSTIAVEDNGKIVLTLEVERFLNNKNVGMAQYKVPAKFVVVMQRLIEWIQKYLNVVDFETCYYSSTELYFGTPEFGASILDLKHFIPAKEYVPCSHHISHAAGVFYQSPFEKALVVSFDGGGDDGKFNIYLAEREAGVKLLSMELTPTDVGFKGPMNLDRPLYDLGFAYMVFAHYIDCIRMEWLPEGNLVYPGKIMGLAGYGTPNREWLPHFMDFYKKQPDAAGDRYQILLDELSEKIGVVFDRNNRLKDQLAYDVAATSQLAFEECFLEVVKPYMETYSDLPICLAGGCALNIILNTRLVEEFGKKVFVGPVPNDTGLAVGMLANVMKPTEPIDITYTGIPILDLDSSMEYFSTKYPHSRQLSPYTDVWDGHTQVTYGTLCDDLINGKIIGLVQGRSEHGPRALGNRSILCNPSYPEMKDILNLKVKNREWYRPFAPVVRLEDVDKYFEWSGDSRWMAFCPRVREEWRDKLSSIVHIDNTARVQTITKEQNPFLYDILTLMYEKTGIGVLLNTSFNVNGKPILSTLRDACKIFDETQMDGLIIEDLYIRKEPFGVFV